MVFGVKDVFEKIENLKDEMVQTLCDLVAIPAISPADGGCGEKAKADYLVKKVRALDLGSIETYNAPDPAADGGIRPNIIVKIKGKTARKVWLVSHMDVVPEGDRSLWSGDPFKAVVADGRLYGRGANDNGQEIVSSLYAAVALKALGIEPEYEVCLCFVADEEVGSRHGICHLIQEGIFSPDDLVYVPDSGSMDGGFIEVAEKSLCWIQFEIEGKQVHASVPDRGQNTCRAANEFSFVLDNALHEAFKETDDLFEPNISTFEPTRRFQNVANVNTVPGREVFCFDCRLLPSIPLEAMEGIVAATAKEIEVKHEVKISWSYLQRNQAPEATSPHAPAVKQLKRAIAAVLSTDIAVGGIGGGTCAAFFRQEGIPAVVWGQANDTAHQPDEYVDIEHIVNEAKVFALVMMGV